MTTVDTYILNMKVSFTSYSHASDLVYEWASRHLSRYVCVAPVSTVMETYDSDLVRRVINAADLVTPDGMAVVWGLKLLGHKQTTRVYGPDLTLMLLGMAASANIPVGFYGGAPQVLDRLCEVASERFPNLRITYACSPPFRALTVEEDELVVTQIGAAEPRILFIGIGSPKQECWMAEHRGRVQCVMVGVGAAFDFLAGMKPQAPRWMMRSGMEWLFRLVTEPRRLWKRYLKQNPRFVVLFALQLLGLKKFPGGSVPEAELRS